MMIESLKLKAELGTAEVIALATAASTLGACLFQMGLLGPAGVSTIALLNLQDILTGAFICLPYLALVVAGFWISRHVAEKHAPIGAMSFFFLMCAVLPMILAVSGFVVGWLPLVVTVALLVFALSNAVGVTFEKFRKYPVYLVLLTMVAIYTPGVIGYTYFVIAKNNISNPNVTVYMDDGSTVVGRGLSMTSSYIFLLQLTGLEIVPLDKVLKVSRVLQNG